MTRVSVLFQVHRYLHAYAAAAGFHASALGPSDELYVEALAGDGCDSCESGSCRDDESCSSNDGLNGSWAQAER